MAARGGSATSAGARAIPNTVENDRMASIGLIVRSFEVLLCRIGIIWDVIFFDACDAFWVCPRQASPA